MIARCPGGQGAKLVEARFLRRLDPGELEALEQHLAGCPPCVERYRRLQLAHRVLAIGAERALEEPAPLELERIAEDLGLHEPPEAEAGFLAFARRLHLARVVPALALALGVAAAVTLVRPGPATEGGLVERGAASSPLTFAVYAVSPSGAVRLLEAGAGAAVAPTERLKVRAALDAGADAARARPPSFAAVLVAAGGAPIVTRLFAPSWPASGVVSLGGSVGLEPATSGPAVLDLVALLAPVDDAELARLAAEATSGSALAELLGARALAVERRALVVRAEAP